MVMIADQTEEDYFRRCPKDKFCEFIDGIVFTFPGLEHVRTVGRSGRSKVWYDRSSLKDSTPW